MANPTTPLRSEAQQRADEIAIFQRRTGAAGSRKACWRLDPAQAASAAQRTTTRCWPPYAGRFDIDRNLQARQLSLGMRVASFLGALALAASVFFLFYQFWGHFGEAAQVAILLGAALASLGLTAAIQGRDASGYFTKLAAMVAFACFVLNLVMLGQIFNITPTDRALIPWAALAFLLAYACDLRLLLAAGICCVIAFSAARVGAWSGIYWLHAGERPENFLPGRGAAVRLPAAGRTPPPARLRADLPRLRPALPAAADAGARPLGLGQLPGRLRWAVPRAAIEAGYEARRLRLPARWRSGSARGGSGRTRSTPASPSSSSSCTPSSSTGGGRPLVAHTAVGGSLLRHRRGETGDVLLVFLAQYLVEVGAVVDARANVAVRARRRRAPSVGVLFVNHDFSFPGI
jgi:hypothetical protein